MDETKDEVIEEWNIDEMKDEVIKQWNMDEIHDEVMKEWLEKCPTHKWQIQNVDSHGIRLSVRFHNEPEENKKDDEDEGILVKTWEME